MEHEHEIETHPPVNKRIGILIGISAVVRITKGSEIPSTPM